MRLFPRTASRRLAAATVACGLAVGALAVPMASADEKGHLKHKQEQAHAQVEHAKQDLDESSSRYRRTDARLKQAVAELSRARDAYRVASAKLRAAEVRDRLMQRRLHEAEDRLARAQDDLSSGQQAADEQRQHVADTISDIYEQGDPQLLAFASLLDAESPADLTRRIEARNVIVGRESRAYDALHAAEVLLQVREDQVEAAKDQVAVQRRAAAEHLVLMEGLHREARAAKNHVLTMVRTRRDARAQAAVARRRDLRDLHAAKQRENHIRQLLLAAARRSRGGYRGPTNGLFIRPVPGPVTSPYGWRIHPIYHYWGLHDGTDFGVACGEPLHAIASGTVVARYWSDVYGNRLYLNLGQINGKNFTAVYNHASGYRVGVGAHVKQGGVVGYVGDTGWSTGCHLHFTLLVNGTAVDPMKYLP